MKYFQYGTVQPWTIEQKTLKHYESPVSTMVL